MKKITLTQGKFAIVDDEDYERVNEYKWYFNGNYAVRRLTAGYKDPNQPKTDKNRIRKTISMHRFILNLPEDNKIEANHRDFDGLHNQKNNLQACTEMENMQYRRKYKKNKNSSQYKGVRKTEKKAKPWQAFITSNKKFIHLGYYKTEIEGAKAYNEAAMRYFGEFAQINDIQRGGGILF